MIVKGVDVIGLVNSVEGLSPTKSIKCKGSCRFIKSASLEKPCLACLTSKKQNCAGFYFHKEQGLQYIH